MTTYGTLARVEAFRSREWSLAILDEAQAIKNPGARQTQAVKALKARARIALTGTPSRTASADLWSIYDFLDPGLLGSAREFSAFAKRLADRPDESYAAPAPPDPALSPAPRQDRPLDRGRPADKTEVKAFCSSPARGRALSEDRRRAGARHRRATQGIERRGLVLAYLMRFKQICNHPAHWLARARGRKAGSGNSRGCARSRRRCGQAERCSCSRSPGGHEPLAAFSPVCSAAPG